MTASWIVEGFVWSADRIGFFFWESRIGDASELLRFGLEMHGDSWPLLLGSGELFALAVRCQKPWLSFSY